MIDPPEERLRRLVAGSVAASGHSWKWIAEKIGVDPYYLTEMLQGESRMSVHWADTILGLCGQRLVFVAEEAPSRQPGSHLQDDLRNRIERANYPLAP